MLIEPPVGEIRRDPTIDQARPSEGPSRANRFLQKKKPAANAEHMIIAKTEGREPGRVQIVDHRDNDDELHPPNIGVREKDSEIVEKKLMMAARDTSGIHDSHQNGTTTQIEELDESL